MHNFLRNNSCNYIPGTAAHLSISTLLVKVVSGASEHNEATC